jgi:hypothetical protein
VDTYAHAFFTWAVAKHGERAGRAAAISSGAVGSLLPDIPAFLGTAYFTGTGYFREGWDAMSSEAVLDAIYFTGPFGGTGSVLHSLVFRRHCSASIRCSGSAGWTCAAYCCGS